jgi:hypothetical protein
MNDIDRFNIEREKKDMIKKWESENGFYDKSDGIIK